MALSSQDLLLINLTKILSQADRMAVRLETEDFVISASRGDLDLPGGTSGTPLVQDAEAALTADSASDVSGEEPDDGPLASEGEVVVRAPIAGTFYSRPEPSAEPFCTIGSEIREQDTVCLIEVMKLFNSIPSGVSGNVRQVLKKDGESVRAGDALFVVRST